MKVVLACIAACMLLCLAATAQAQEPMEPKEGEAFIYASSNCEGPFLVATNRTLLSDLGMRSTPGGGSYDHRVGCVQLGPQTRAILFVSQDFKGRALDLARTSDNPSGKWTLDSYWKKEVSSIVVIVDR